MERFARFVYFTAVGGICGWAFFTGTPALASLSASPIPAIVVRQDVHPEDKGVKFNQVALAHYKSGQRSQALRLWKSHAEEGNPEAQFILGVFYYRGNAGLGKDIIESVSWYRKAAEQGHMNAQYNLGILYATGNGLVLDPAVAIQWWRMAAVQGHVEAQFNLGLFYSEGTGVSPDPVEAVKWWGLAAERGLAAAQFNLGLMYMKGEGIDENPDEAIRLWRLSANQGFTQAITLLKVLQLDP